MMHHERETKSRILYYLELLLHILGASILIIYNLIVYHSKSTSSTTWFTYFYPKIAQRNFSPDSAWALYLVMIGFGCISIFCSCRLLFRSIVYYTTRVFKESARVLEQLLFTCDPMSSSKNEMPYMPLNRPVNVTAFLALWQWIKKYQHGYYLGQSSTGLVGILLISVGLILAIVIGCYIPNLRLSLVGTIIFVYYAILTTAISAKQLYYAVEINTIHEKILQEFDLWKCDLSIGAVGSEKNDATYRMLNEGKEIMKSQFKPVRVAGIPATPTLANIYLLYLGTCAAATAYYWLQTLSAIPK
jgi:hypothetical protein